MTLLYSPILGPGRARDRGTRRRYARLVATALAFATAGGLTVGPQAASADPSRGSTGRPAGPSIATPRPSNASSSSRSTPRPASAKPPTGAKSSSKSSAGGLGSGAKGPAVLELQTLLQTAGYDVPEITGTYGDQTYHAVMAFQKANGLSRSGRAGNQTLDALRAGATPSPIIPDGGPDRIEVSLPKQYLAVYRGGSLIRILSISSGNGKEFCTLDPETGETGCDKAVTPAGSFRVSRRVVGWRESKLGLLYNPLYFNGGIAVHGAPSVPGNPASHGCVRIPMVSADYIPTVVPNGMPVYVSDGSTPLKVITSRISPAEAWNGPTVTTVPGSASTVPGPPTTTVPGASTTVGPPTTTTTPQPTLARPLTTTTLTPAPTAAPITAAPLPTTTVAATTAPAPTPAPTTTVPPLPTS